MKEQLSKARSGSTAVVLEYGGIETNCFMYKSITKLCITNVAQHAFALTQFWLIFLPTVLFFFYIFRTWNRYSLSIEFGKISVSSIFTQHEKAWKLLTHLYFSCNPAMFINFRLRILKIIDIEKFMKCLENRLDVTLKRQIVLNINLNESKNFDFWKILIWEKFKFREIFSNF